MFRRTFKKRASITPTPPPPEGEKRKKSLTRVPLAAVCCARRGGHSRRRLGCPRRDNGMGRGAGHWRGEAARRQYTQKVCLSQQHLPTVHPHAVPPSTHMLLRTKRCSTDAQAHISSPPPPARKNPPPGCCGGCVSVCCLLPFSGAPAPVEHTRVHVRTDAAPVCLALCRLCVCVCVWRLLERRERSWEGVEHTTGCR